MTSRLQLRGDQSVAIELVALATRTARRPPSGFTVYRSPRSDEPRPPRRTRSHAVSRWLSSASDRLPPASTCCTTLCWCQESQRAPARVDGTEGIREACRWWSNNAARCAVSPATLATTRVDGAAWPPAVSRSSASAQSGRLPSDPVGQRVRLGPCSLGKSPRIEE